MTKQEIRSHFLKMRLALSIGESKELNLKLCVNFFATINLSNVKVLHIFLPILSKNEPNTWLIIEKLKKDFPDTRISIPRVEKDQLINFYFEEAGQLKKNKWGILEPISGEPTLTDKIDLVVVPLVAIDKKGNRIGYGKGFYDKFLKECRKDCRKIGLSFFEPIDEIPSDLHDVRLNQLVNSQRAISFE